MHRSWEDTAETLTLQAVQAAEEGQWNTVGLYYQRRGELFRTHDISRLLARRLQLLDARIHERLRMATMAIQHLLTEVASKRRLLERFDSQPHSHVPEDCRRVNRLV